MRTDRARISYAGIALVIKELYGKARVKCRLIGIRDRPSTWFKLNLPNSCDLSEMRWSDANGKLIGDR